MKKKYWVAMALSLGLPSAILGIFAFVYSLVDKEIISWNVALIIMLAVIINTFYLILRYARSKKN